MMSKISFVLGHFYINKDRPMASQVARCSGAQIKIQIFNKHFNLL